MKKYESWTLYDFNDNKVRKMTPNEIAKLKELTKTK